MTDFKTSDRDVNRAIRSWLREDRHEDVSRVAGAVLDQVDTTPQRRTTWWPARRTPTMNKMLTIGLGAAAVVVVALIGSQLIGSPTPAEPAPERRHRRSRPTPSRPRRRSLRLPSRRTSTRARTSSLPREGSPSRSRPLAGTRDDRILVKNENSLPPDGAS